MGYWTFLTIYLLSGLAGSTASFLFSDLVTVGASGAIFGLLGRLTALVVCSSRQDKCQFFVEPTAAAVHPSMCSLYKQIDFAMCHRTGATAGYFLRNRAVQGSTQQLLYIAGVVALNVWLGSAAGSMIDNSGTCLRFCLHNLLGNVTAAHIAEKE